MGEREAEGLRHHLRRCRRAEELAPAAGSRAGPATEIGRLLQRDQAEAVARPDRLDLPGVFAALWRERDAAGDNHTREIREPAQRHEHRRKALVAGGDPEHPLPQRERSGQAPQHRGGVVAVGEAVEHPRRSLAAAVTGIGAEAGEGDLAEPTQLLRGRFDEEPDLPVAGVVAEGHRAAIRGAHAPLRGENQKLRIGRSRSRPSHADVLRQPEEIPRGSVPEHLIGERQRSGWTLRRRGDGVDIRGNRAVGIVLEGDIGGSHQSVSW